MNRTTRLTRLLELLKQIEPLALEFDQLLNHPRQTSEIASEFTESRVCDEAGIDTGDDDWLPYAVIQTYSTLLHQIPPRSIEEIRALPRAVQNEALWRFATPDASLLDFFRTDYLWPPAWAFLILDNPQVRTVEDVLVIRTQLMDKRLSSEYCCHCGKPMPNTEDFGFLTTSTRNNMADADLRLTCRPCLDREPPHIPQYDAPMTFLRLVKVKTKLARVKG